MLKMGRVDPEDIAPDLGRYTPILGAVMELSTERQIGFSAGPIPVSVIDNYLDRHGLPDWWAPVITRVDSHILSSMNEEKKAKSA